MVVQRRLEHAHRLWSAVAGRELAVGKPQDYTVGGHGPGFPTLPGVYYKVAAEDMVRLARVDTAQLVAEAKNTFEDCK